MPHWLSPETERAAALLEAHPDYRVLRSLPPLDLLPLPEPEGRIRTALVLDTETTGVEALKGDRKGQCSIRINDQFRICFRWTPDGPERVEIVDDH